MQHTKLILGIDIETRLVYFRKCFKFCLIPTKNPHLVCNIMKFTTFQMNKQVVMLLSKKKFINIHPCIVDLKIDNMIKITCHEVINVTLGAIIETPPLYPTHSAKGLFGLSFFI